MELRHWKEIVASVHSDFMAKLLDAELSALVTGKSFWDDRTEGPRHRNPMLPGVKG